MSSTIVELENEIKKIQEDMKQIHTELSILMEYYGNIYELMDKLNHQIRKKEELEYSKPLSILQSNSEVQSTKESAIDQKLRRVVSNIFRDYYERGRE